MAILDWLAAHTQADHRLVSIMGQYTPMPGAALPEHALSRTITTMEYDSVVQHAAELDLQGIARSAVPLVCNSFQTFQKIRFPSWILHNLQKYLINSPCFFGRNAV